MESIKVWIVTGYDAHNESILGVFLTSKSADEFVKSGDPALEDWAGITQNLYEVKP